MKLYKPQVNLSKRSTTDGDYEYFMHAITFFDTTGYAADGYEVRNFSDPTMNTEVLLKIRVNKSLNLEYLTPVVHTLPLGRLNDEVDTTKIDVKVMYGERMVGRTTQDPEDSDDDDGKPIPTYINE